MGAMIFILMGSAVGNAARLSLDASPTALQRKGGGLATKPKIVTVNGANHYRRSEMSFSGEKKRVEPSQMQAIRLGKHGLQRFSIVSQPLKAQATQRSSNAVHTVQGGTGEQQPSSLLVYCVVTELQPPHQPSTAPLQEVCDGRQCCA